MIFIKTDQEGFITMQHHFPFHAKWGMGKTEEELLQDGFLVDAVPEIEVQEGKHARLKYVDGNFTTEYEDAPKVNAMSDIDLIKAENAELKAAIGKLEEKSAFYEEVLTEIIMSINQ